jgi:hypothetical protein
MVKLVQGLTVVKIPHRDVTTKPVSPPTLDAINENGIITSIRLTFVVGTLTLRVNRLFITVPAYQSRILMSKARIIQNAAADTANRFLHYPLISKFRVSILSS